jgi:bifunctional non-homologous end joining protein LigD
LLNGLDILSGPFVENQIVNKGLMPIGNYNFEISKKEKVLFPKSSITKNDIALYYNAMADHILPFLKDRPLTMQRFPQGIESQGFFQKNASEYFPDWVQTVKIKKVDGWLNQVICNTKETLLYLVNQYTLTFHVTLSTVDSINYPDKLIFDLDPPEGNFKLAVDGAKTIRQLLEEELKLKTYIMTSGSRGLHVAVPLKCLENFDEVLEFARQTSQYIAEKNPEKYTTALRKKQRKGRLYIDFLRNSYMQTSVSPFSIRAIMYAPVATPLQWTELNDTELSAQTYTIHNILKRLEHVENPWRDFNKNAKSILSAKKRLYDLMN